MLTKHISKSSSPLLSNCTITSHRHLAALTSKVRPQASPISSTFLDTSRNYCTGRAITLNKVQHCRPLRYSRHLNCSFSHNHHRLLSTRTYLNMSDSTASSSVASSPASSAVLGPSSASTTSIASAPSSPKGSFLTNDATVTAALKTQPGTMGNCLSSIRGYAQSAVAVQEARDIDFEPKLETIQPLTNSGNKGDSFSSSFSVPVDQFIFVFVGTNSTKFISLAQPRRIPLRTRALIGELRVSPASEPATRTANPQFSLSRPLHPISTTHLSLRVGDWSFSTASPKCLPGWPCWPRG
jgi:hypothetical protein